MTYVPWSVKTTSGWVNIDETNSIFLEMYFDVAQPDDFIDVDVPSFPTPLRVFPQRLYGVCDEVTYQVARDQV